MNIPEEYKKYTVPGVIIALLLILFLFLLTTGDDHPDRPTAGRKRKPRTTQERHHLPAAKKKKKKSTEEKKEEEPLVTEEDFHEALIRMGESIVSDDLPYNGNAGDKTREGAEEFNCALYVSWTLQDLGLLPEGNTFWFNDKGHGNGYIYMRKHSSRFEISHPNCSIKSASMLKPFDICGMEINGYAPHTAVFGGRDKDGNMLWYSAGRTDFGKMAKKGFKPIRFKYYEQEKDILYTVVRIKFDQKEK